VTPDTAAALAAILLTPFAALGIALMNCGLCRSRNAAHMMMGSLAALSVAALAYFVCGFSWQGYPGLPVYVLHAGGKEWDWIAAQPFFLRKLPLEGPAAWLGALLGIFSAGVAALIPLGSGGERWRLSGICASSAVLAGFTYPLFGHWAQTGWLAQLGYTDAGGTGAIHVVGGLTALSIVWILGPRRGKYNQDGIPQAMPGHHGVYVVSGCMFAWIGWMGLNSAGAILFAAGHAETVVRIAVNTTLSACGAALAAALATRTRFGKPDFSLSANGWTGGLVAISGACAIVPPAGAALIGLVAGAVVALCIEQFELRLSLDDPGGGISVHAIGGIWGILATGIFAGQALPQVVAVATLLGFVLPLSYGLNAALDRIAPMRAPAEGERHGLDLHELGAGAYPEFLTHTEEFLPR
jgi:ammonium transporter, Amt family